MSTPATEPPRYCAFYCEENIWQLCAHPRVADRERKVLILSNHLRRVAMWGQRAAASPERPVGWDYHVVLLVRAAEPAPEPWLVWDLDSVTPEPRPASAWVHASFDRVGLLPPAYAPRFRLLDCADYRRYLRSDRRHMLGPDGRPRQPPPPWPPILGEPVPGAADDGSNLAGFTDVDDPRFPGERLDLPGLRAWLAQTAQTSSVSNSAS